MRGIPFCVFSMRRIEGSGQEILAGRSVIDVLEDRRFLSAAPDASAHLAGGVVEMALHADLHKATELSSGAEFERGETAPIQLAGVNGPQKFSAAPIDDGSGRDNLHGSGAEVDFIEWTQDTAQTPSLVAHVDGAAGKFAYARIMTGNISPVANYAAAPAVGPAVFA